ncbi:hypothetical protein UlMin_039845 [Ulmus minor]
MAMGKSRNNKRSSSTSYTSTVTMVIFVGLCFLAVWVLTANDVVPVPQTSSRSTTTNQQSNKAADTTTTVPFEDTPGDLPDDAIKSDDQSQTNNSDNNTNEGDNHKSSEEKQEEQETKQIENQQTHVANQEISLNQQVEQTNDEKITLESEKIITTNEESNISVNTENKVEETKQVMFPEMAAEDPKRKDERQQNEEKQDKLHVVGNYKEDQQQGGGGGGEVVVQDLKTSETKLQSDQTHENNQQEEKEQKDSDLTTKSSEPQQEFTDVTNQDQESQKNNGGKGEEKAITESFPGGETTGIPKESKESKKSWSTQAAQSENEKERRKDESDGQEGVYGYTWQLCNVTSGPDYIPCLDNEKAVKKLRSTRHFEHRERHCPEEGPTCLVTLPEAYKRSIEWPASRDKIWYHNVPHKLLAEVKGHQNWVKVTGEFLTFPGGGTQFIHGALHYIDFVEEAVPDIAWGKQTRVVLDVGCGVASFGGFLFERDVLTMSFAPKDEHEAQVQFALERGIPAISAVMGSQRLPFPSRVYDLIHCARCRVPWHNEGGTLLLELNRVLRPGGYFVWSATPVYQKLEEDVEIWKAMSSLTKSICWELVTIKKDKLNSIGAAIYRKPTTNDCYEQRKHKQPPLCKEEDDANAAWYVPLQSCMHRVPVKENERGSQWPENWPLRLQTPPYWLNNSQMGIYGKPASQDFLADYEHWKRVVNNSYLNRLGISWNNVRNVMDMRAVYGGFAAAMKDMLKIWVLNVVNVDSPDTLPIIYERGLFGIYHDWCESFSTYPRTYDLLHADHLFSRLKKRCKLVPVLAEVDRIVRPGGKLIVRDESRAIGEVENLLKSLHWEVRLTFSKNQEGILSAQKGDWRPKEFTNSS